MAATRTSLQQSIWRTTVSYLAGSQGVQRSTQSTSADICAQGASDYICYVNNAFIFSSVQRLQQLRHRVVCSLQSSACFSTAALETRLQDDISMLLLGVDVGIEVRLAGVDGLLDALGRVAALLHVPLQLPGKLDIVTDVQVQLEVQQVPHALVKEGMKALHHQDLQSRSMLFVMTHWLGNLLI